MNGGGYLSDAGGFLVETVIGLYLLLVLLRFLFQMSRVDFYNPISQFLVAATNPPLRVLRGFVPALGGIDVAPIVLLLLLGVVKLYLKAVMLGVFPAPVGVVVIAVAEILKLTAYVYIFTVFARAVSSWFNPNPRHPVMRLLIDLTEPPMAMARRLLPAFGGIDLSPIVVFIVLTLALKLFVQPLFDVGAALLR
jgi:YggT family protein